MQSLRGADVCVESRTSSSFFRFQPEPVFAWVRFFFLVASFGRLHAPNKGRIGAGRGHLHTKKCIFSDGEFPQGRICITT